MASNGNTAAGNPSPPGPSGNAPPRKPWEGAPSAGPSPFRPPSTGSTSTVVEASGTAKPGETVSGAVTNTNTNMNAITRPVPARPWEQNYGNNYGGYGGGGLTNYNTGYGSTMYGGGMYGGGGGLYGNNMYNRGIGSTYGGGMYGGGMYGGGMYGGGLGGSMGGYGAGMGPYANQDPNNPFGAPEPPPSFWMSFLRVMHGVVNFFGRISVLIDQNTQAFHMFMTALLQLFDRSGVLYGELARFVLRLLGIRTRSKKPQQLGNGQLPPGGQQLLEGPKAAAGSWDTVWGGDASNGN